MIDFEKSLFDKGSSLPLYVQVANWMRSRIITGEWAPGYKLLPEVDLAEKLDVSRGTLRQAISLLIDEKMIEQSQGKGTFVGKAVYEQNWAYKLVSTFEELNGMGIPFKTKVLELRKKEISESRILRKLQLKDLPSSVVYLKRLRLVDSTPVVIHETFFPFDPYIELLDVDFTKKGMTETLEKDLGIELDYADHTISALYPERDIDDLLEAKNGEPIIYNEHVMYSKKGDVVEFTKGWFRGDRFRLKTRVFR